MPPHPAPLLLLLALLAAPAALAEDLAVIVHRDRQDRIDVEQISRIYLKQRRFWRNGDTILPVNRDSASATRAVFDRLVFGANVRNLDVYWNRQYFRGILPPATLASDEAVKRFVAGERRAIGYVRSTSIDDSIRVILHLTDPSAGTQPNDGTGLHLSGRR